MTRPKLKHRWRVDFNYLCGMTTGAWLRLLRENRFDVDLTYAHRAAFVTAMSVPNTFFAWVERLRFARRLSAVTEVPPPLFVLGHYRRNAPLGVVGVRISAAFLGDDQDTAVIGDLERVGQSRYS